MKRIALITGGNRGIGLEICRELGKNNLHVILTSRGQEAGEGARDQLAKEGHDVSWFGLDVSSADDIQAMSEHIQNAHGGLDILVNNAGVSFNGFNAKIARDTVDINFFGSLHLSDALLPLVRQGGRIVMVSSGMGDRAILSNGLQERFRDEDPQTRMARDELVALMTKFIDDVAAKRHAEEGWPSSAYCVSKIGMTKLAEIMARELEAQGNPKKILINASCPGWVRTDMGGERADRSIKEGADTPVWLSLLPEGAPNGGFFRDRQPVAW